MLSQLRPSLAMLAIFTGLTGLAYPFAMTGLAGVAFPHQAQGSLLVEGGTVIGSELIGQSFASERYFRGRPSAVNYDASTSSGSNLGPSSTRLADEVRARAEALGGGPVPADLVTASGSGLDPDVSPAAALFQAERVAMARALPLDRVRALIEAHVTGPQLGILGKSRVNVLALNRALDALPPDQ